VENLLSGIDREGSTEVPLMPFEDRLEPRQTVLRFART
jgi:hypothetical protein